MTRHYQAIFPFNLSLAVTLGLMMVVIGPSQTVVAQNNSALPGAAKTTPDTVDVKDVADDAQIIQRLTNIYESTERFGEIQVDSKSGFVTLRGVTQTDKNSEWATEVASRTQDVVGVNNLIEVKSAVDLQKSLTLVWKSIDKLYRDFLARVPFLIAGVVVLIITWFAARMLNWLLPKFLNRGERIRISLRDLIIHLSSITLWVIGFLVAAVVVFPGMTPAKALTVLGLGSVAIGFAFKDIFENFFAGVLILWKYPFDKGDYIQLGETMGRVEEITIRNTMIRRTDGELVVVPNGHVFKSNVEVLTSHSKRRIRLICGVAYHENIDESRNVIEQALAKCTSVDQQKEIQVFANEFADSSVNFEVAWWAGATPVEVRRSRDEVITKVKAALDDAGIEIPFPYRTLTFADSAQPMEFVSQSAE